MHITQAFWGEREFSGIPRTVPWAHLLCVHVLCVYKKLLELLFLFSVIFSFFFFFDPYLSVFYNANKMYIWVVYCSACSLSGW